MLKFKIVTPERIVLETEADSVSLPTPMGEITILPNHIPLVSNLVAGELRYKKGNHEELFAVSGGFIEVRKNHEVILLADTAEAGEEIDIERAEEARERARVLMLESSKDHRTHADATAAFAKHLTRIKVAHKHRSRRSVKLQ